MKKYVCTVCGYVHNGELPDDFVCPVCGAGKGAFKEVVEGAAADVIEKPQNTLDKELSAMEMSIICSNLARGCEKQYMPAEAEKFASLGEFFRKKAGNAEEKEGFLAIAALLKEDIDKNYPYAHSVADAVGDRGAKRSLVWSEKVTRMLQSILARYEKEGDNMPEHSGVYLCSICGFVYVGEKAPDLCPVCKVPSWKFEKLERRAQ